MANVYASDEFTHNQVIDGQTSIVSVVVVLSVVLGFQIVASIEELADVSASSPLNNELATWVVRGVVSCINDEIVNQQQMSSAFPCDCVEFFFGHRSCWSDQVNVGSNENLVADFHNKPRHNKHNSRCKPEVGKFVSLLVVTSDTSNCAESCNYDYHVT